MFNAYLTQTCDIILNRKHMKTKDYYTIDKHLPTFSVFKNITLKVSPII